MVKSTQEASSPWEHPGFNSIQQDPTDPVTLSLKPSGHAEVKQRSLSPAVQGRVMKGPEMTIPGLLSLAGTCQNDSLKTSETGLHIYPNLEQEVGCERSWGGEEGS